MQPKATCILLDSLCMMILSVECDVNHPDVDALRLKEVVALD